MKNALIRPATSDDLDAIEALLPRLAEFSLPPGRKPGELWEGDAAALRTWASTGDPSCIVLVAEAPTTPGADSDAAQVVGVAFVRLRPELLSHDPSAHLEVLAIAPAADGHGLGRRLLAEAERLATARGAQSMTLHVFANNTRARSVYERQGYSGELLRYIKPLSQ